MKHLRRLFFLLLLLAAVALQPEQIPTVRASEPRLVVFEGFYNPG